MNLKQNPKGYGKKSRLSLPIFGQQFQDYFKAAMKSLRKQLIDPELLVEIEVFAKK